jgi:gamma-glutamylcysteine synthetase
MLDAMTDVLPDGAELRRHLRHGFCGIAHRYYAEIRTAFTIAADGTVAQCFEVSDVTLAEATRIAAACDDIDEWSVDSFQAIIAEVLGQVGNRMQ